MPLGKSLAVTLLITAAIWSMAFFGSTAYVGQAQAFVSDNRAAADSSLQLIGISESVDLALGDDEVIAVWQQFYDMTALHLSLDRAQAARVYGYYRFDRVDPNHASLTIGYDSSGDHRADFPILAQLSRDDYQLVFESTDSQDATTAWAQLDHSRPLHSVLEEYELDAGEVIATRVYVFYQSID